ncbi:helix-turn-helix domain-containing protein [Solitalea canadensis]|nr:helix-turn-helix domain-containing protein [Solitalea canadensis]
MIDLRGIPVHSLGQDIIRTFNLSGSAGISSLEPHRHEFYEIIYFENAQGSQRLDFNDFEVYPETLTFISPGQIHQLKTKKFEGIIITFTAAAFSRTDEEIAFLQQYTLFHKSGANTSMIPMGEDKEVLLSLIKAINKESRRADSCQNILKSYLKLFLEIVARAYRVTHKLFDSTSHDAERINKLQNLIELNFTREHLAPFYASSLNLTPKRLNEICKKIVGKTVTSLLAERINLEAKRLTGYSNQTIKEIAFQLGFDDPSYFSRFFKKKNGHTPEEFRSQCSNSTIH